MRSDRTTAPARSPPKALFFYHVPKTGGSTVREWLLRNAGVRSPRGAQKRFSGIVRYYEAVCFVCLQFGHLLGPEAGAVCTAGAKRKCHAYKLHPNGAFDFNVEEGWRGAQVAVEFHGSSDRFFMAHVLPRMSAFQQLYAEHNGTCASAVLVREPVGFLFSNYYMWPPRPHPTDNSIVSPFPRWLSTAAGLQSGFLTVPFCTNSSRATGQRSFCGCGGSKARQAVSALKRFDIVGLTSCMPSFFDAVERRIGLGADTAMVRLQRRAMKGNASLGPMRAMPRCAECVREGALAWKWDTLDEDTRTSTQAVARCDAGLYRAAVLRVSEWPSMAVGLAALSGDETERCIADHQWDAPAPRKEVRQVRKIMRNLHPQPSASVSTVPL